MAGMTTPVTWSITVFNQGGWGELEMMANPGRKWGAPGNTAQEQAQTHLPPHCQLPLPATSFLHHAPVRHLGSGR